MSCEKYQQQMILCLYKELDSESSKKLKNHIKKCPECAEEWGYTKRIFNLVEETKAEEIPEADWEKCWTRIDEKVPMSETRTKGFFWLFPKWAVTAAALLCVLVIGIYIGRTALSPGTELGSTAGSTKGAFYLSLQQHFDELKPLLMEYAHYREDQNGEIISADKKLVEDLLIQNILLKRRAAQEYPGAEQLLEDIGLILREITNMDEKGTTVPLRIKDFINHQRLLNSMEVYQTI
ncbi:MAG: hypothetical protein GF421_09600 [Candidatus Aminicenantes bacterium]|nr:hypothetical protein [Candidatus Aminicenantes bacterium]